MPNGRHSIEIKACTVQKSKHLQDTACMGKTNPPLLHSFFHPCHLAGRQT
ncbi:hypothetical protein HMPREF9141_2601 [Prevotella multiformis DSM 16608]|uniref:Uncharacterized protein n=1 Tax=Prevotella multiformis DSM 16608 TaxID=888743 RepID=F0FAI4_9BACT|nr:hypothetical protein HMPREF9141_2601 [Prevotella multiformis DSM 16608]